jgi:hypothetical protein
MKNYLYILVFLLACTACASQKKEEQDIEEKAAHSTVADPKALGGTIQELIHNSKTLSADQKDELQKIITVNKDKADKLSEKSFKFRGVLIQELLSGDVSPKRVEILKNDIKQVEALRLRNTFDTVEKISALVSNHPEKEKFAEHLMNFERPSR